MNTIIDLTKGVSAILIKRRNESIIPILIDRNDAAKVKKNHWFFHFGYCCTRDEHGKQVNINSIICKPPKDGEVFYYKNGDKRDNRKTNLGVTTISLKQYLQKTRSNGTTGRTGISHYATGSYAALIGGIRQLFKTYEEALAAREAFERSLGLPVIGNRGNKKIRKK